LKEVRKVIWVLVTQKMTKEEGHSIRDSVLVTKCLQKKVFLDIDPRREIIIDMHV